MKFIRIDTTINSYLLSQINDYTSVLVLASIADPLFKYNSNTNQIEKFACESYIVKNNGKNHIFYLKNNLYYNNGKQIFAIDYKLAIENLLNENILLKYRLKEIKKITCDGLKLKIELNNKNYNFYKIFSSINLSPQDNLISSGPYSIKYFSKEKIIVTKNKYYRNFSQCNHSEDLCFLYSDNLDNDIDLFRDDKLSLTCNTYFPQENFTFCEYPINIYSSNLIFELNFIRKEYYNKNCSKLRKAIFNSISTNQITSALNKVLTPFPYKRKKTNFYFDEHRSLTLAYDDYYPNEIIAKNLKFQIEENTNLKINLYKDNYYNPDNNYDLKLNIVTPDYFGDIAYYDSPRTCHFVKIIKPIHYKNYLKIINNKNPNKHCHKLYRTLSKCNIRYPLFYFNHIYLSTHYFKNFNFNEFNYEILK